MEFTLESIVKDWKEKFPHLGVKGRSGLYKNYHYLYLGLQILWFPSFNEYKIALNFYSLMGYNSAQWNNTPVVNYFYPNERGVQMDISFEDHVRQFDLIAGKVLTDTSNILGDVVKFQYINNKVREILSSKIFNLNPGVIGRIESFKFLFHLASALDSVDEAKKILDEIQGFRTQLSMKYFVEHYGDFDLWLLGLEKAIGQGARFRANADNLQTIASLRKLPKGTVVL